MQNLVIDALAFCYKKSPGYESFLTFFLDKLLLYRAKVKCDKIIIAVCRGQEQHFQKYASQFEVIVFNCPSILSRTLTMENLPKKLRLSKEDIIIYTAGYGGRKKRCKSILVVHDLQYLHLPQYWSKLKRIHRKLYVGKPIKNADKVVTISEATKDDVLNIYGVESAKVETIYNIINFEEFKLIPENTDKIKDEYFICVSSAAPHKNLLTLLKAFEIFVAKNPSYKLYLTVSASKLEPEAKGIADRIRDNVVFLNYVNKAELARLYSDCKAFVSATLFEGFGLPIAEALYFNKITLLSDIPICREIGADDAYYFNAKDCVELAQLFEKVCNNELEAKNSRDRILNMVSDENTILKYIAAINEI